MSKQLYSLFLATRAKKLQHIQPALPTTVYVANSFFIKIYAIINKSFLSIFFKKLSQAVQFRMRDWQWCMPRIGLLSFLLSEKIQYLKTKRHSHKPQTAIHTFPLVFDLHVLSKRLPKFLPRYKQLLTILLSQFFSLYPLFTNWFLPVLAYSLFSQVPL